MLLKLLKTLRIFFMETEYKTAKNIVEGKRAIAFRLQQESLELKEEATLIAQEYNI